jgi:transcriptional regulator with XRE-family HTH domain
MEDEETILAEEATKEIREKMTLGNTMRAFRETEEIPLSTLARRLGVTRQFLCDVENDRKNVGVPFIRKFANELGFSPEAFIRIYVRDLLRKGGLSDYDIRVEIKKKAS